MSEYKFLFQKVKLVCLFLVECNWCDKIQQEKVSLHKFKTNVKSHWDELLNTASFFDVELMMSFSLDIFLEGLFENEKKRATI